MSSCSVVIYFAMYWNSPAQRMFQNPGFPLCTRVWTKQSWDEQGHGLLFPPGQWIGDKGKLERGCPKLCGLWKVVLPRQWFTARLKKVVLTRTGDQSHVSWKAREPRGANSLPIGRIPIFCLKYVFLALCWKIVFRTLKSEHSSFITSWLSAII